MSTIFKNFKFIFDHFLCSWFDFIASVGSDSWYPESSLLFFSIMNGFHGISIIWIINGMIVNQWVVIFNILSNPELDIFRLSNLNINRLVNGWNVSVVHSIFFISNCFSSIWIIREWWSINIFTIDVFIKSSA